MAKRSIPALIQPERELLPNKSKQIQIKPSKTAWIWLVLFGRIETFQWVAGEKIKKSGSRLRLRVKRLKPGLPLPLAASRSVSRKLDLAKASIQARLSNFVK
jgi:hypothetical protein